MYVQDEAGTRPATILAATRPRRAVAGADAADILDVTDFMLLFLNTELALLRMFIVTTIAYR